jgi:hypothetical protein
VPYLWATNITITAPSVSRYQFDQFSGYISLTQIAVNNKATVWAKDRCQGFDDRRDEDHDEEGVFVDAPGQLITLDNVSQVPHAFTVTGHGIDVETQPGKTSLITIDLPPGIYPLICRFHVSLGMKGTLVVS